MDLPSADGDKPAWDCTAATGRGGGYSIYPWVGRCCAAPHTLTLFKTNITDFPTLFRTEFRFLIPCLSQWKSILINIRACKNFAAYRPRQDILFKTKIDKSIPWLRQKMINSIPCLRQKSRKTYPGWPHVPIKGVPPPAGSPWQCSQCPCEQEIQCLGCVCPPCQWSIIYDPPQWMSCQSFSVVRLYLAET